MTETSAEIARIREVYAQRNEAGLQHVYQTYWQYTYWSRFEREYKMTEFLTRHFSDLSQIKVLDVGAGTGDYLLYFKRLGLGWNQIEATELLEDRCRHLKQNFPQVKLYEGDSSQKLWSGSYDLVFQSTVMSSVLDSEFRERFCQNLWESLKPGGVLLWYDFFMNNPSNKNVRGISFSEIERLFPEGRCVLKRKVTLAPPLGRRVGGFYPYLNLPFLRTHLLVGLQKS